MPARTARKAAKPKAPAKAKPAARKPKPAAGAAPKPRAAGGGAVKVAKAEGHAPVQAYIARLPAWQGRFLQAFDDLVAKEVPQARRAVKWSAPFYGVPGNGWFASTKAFSRHVKLTFFAGTSLRPVPPSGESETGRSLDLREGDTFDEGLVGGWVRQAAALPGWGTS